MTLRRVLFGICAISVTLCGAGCSPTEPTGTDAVPEENASATAGLVVENLEKDGRVILHPVDTTRADCVEVQCEQAVTTDRFRIMSFATTGDAQRYAADRGLRQVATLVVDFSPTVPPPERDALWTQIVTMVT